MRHSTFLLAHALSLAAACPVMAQAAVPAEPAPETQPARPPMIEVPNLFGPGSRDSRYAIPDLAQDRILIPRLNTRFLTVRPGIELILDYTAFGQDDASIAQVGTQANRLEARSVSLDLSGEFGLQRRLDYKVGVEYNGFDVETDKSFAVTDFNIAYAIPKWRTRIRLGQMREDFGFEIVGSTATMPQSERILGPFASPINFGLKVTHQLGRDGRATLTYGIFKDDWGEGGGKLAISARATYLAIDQPSRRLHIGAALRQADISSTIQYKGTPGVAAAEELV